MNSSSALICVGCGGLDLTPPLVLEQQPVVQNYRFNSPAAASQVARRPIRLVQCRTCGLIFNAAFEAGLVNYDAAYDNSQTYSPAFTAYLERLAARLITRYDLRRKCILEVGCGKGFFLQLICRQGDNHGLGYDTSYEGPDRLAAPAVEFVRRYLSPDQVTPPLDAVLCRHVIEHVPQTRPFLQELRAIAGAGGNPVTVLETPSFEWIAANTCFWDIFYEHCTYFSRPTLAYLCQKAGFEVVRHLRDFHGQYQVLELRLRPSDHPATLAPPGIGPEADLMQFAQTFELGRQALERRLAAAGAGRGWAIWGAGAKGVALANQLTCAAPEFVIDSNPAKQGCVIPGAGLKVLAPDDPRILEVAVILIANPNYWTEIKAFLTAKGFHHALLTP